NDAFAWCLLAVVLATHKATASIAVYGIGGGLLFGLLMMTIGRRCFSFLESWFKRAGEITPPIFVPTMAALMLAAWFTDSIGIYAVFGAFIVGAAMPKGAFADQLREKIEMPTVNLLLPLFFVYSGLNTKIGLVNTPYLWMITGVVVLFAVGGKGAGCAL